MTRLVGDTRHEDPAAGDEPTVLGLDIGGSKTRAVVAVGGRVVGGIDGGAANPSSVGGARSAQELHRILDALLGDGGRVHAVGAGVAGADSAAARDRVRDMLQARLPGVPVEVVHDAQLVLAAADLQEGLVAVSGTGSAAWGRTAAGATARAGGWGYLLGDEGSGYGMVRAAVQHVLGRSDSGLPLDDLGRALLTACDVVDPDALLDAFYADPTRRRWAAHAPALFDLAAGGDPAARVIVDLAAGELARSVSRVGERLGLRRPVVLSGGLVTHQPLLLAAVRERLSGLGFDDVRLLAGHPVDGAVALARRALTAAGAGRA